MAYFNQVVTLQKDFFLSGATKPYAFRKKQLQRLKKMLQKNERKIYSVLKKELNKSRHETFTTELGVLYAEIDFALKNLAKWMEPKHVPAPLTHKGTSNTILKEPYGVTLIISPWNYPVQLAFAPVIGAIAAGNTIVLKPSELTPHTAALIVTMVRQTFSENFFTVVEGGKTVSEQLLNEKFDYIFFTGSTKVGKIIMQKAGQHLTPITLELGGKSPVIIDQDANIKLAAKRIVWGKFTNAGQTCVAPDYLIVHKEIKTKLIHAMKKAITSLYGKQPLNNKHYVRIVNQDHFERLTRYLQDGRVLHGGRTNIDQLMIEPTLLADVTWQDNVMKEEIFGPILPILSYSKLSEVIHMVQRQEKPLALYYFGENQKNKQKVLDSLSFGGGCINDTLYHLANPHLPFGGVGESGMGAYHGEYSFTTFSHEKSILKQTTMFDIPLRYPGSKLAYSIVKRIMK